MLKIVATVFVGAAVGTLAYEVIKGRKNGALRNIGQNTRDAVSAFVEAFREGYEGSAR